MTAPVLPTPDLAPAASVTNPLSPPASARSHAFLSNAGGTAVMANADADIAGVREQQRRKRILGTALVLAILAWVLTLMAGLPWIALLEDPLAPIAIEFILLIVFVVAYFNFSGRSPHTLMRPEHLTTRLDDVVGLAPVKEEVIRSLNLFLSHESFAKEMGGSPRRGLLFEGPPGTGKTHTAKAMAGEAGVPFLFATATSFQSSFYGATSRKIRAYFKELRKVARAEGGAIGYIDEFDAIGGRRNGMEMRENGGTRGLVRSALGTSDLTGPVVNELLVQMQSIDTPVGWAKAGNWLREQLNPYLPAHRRLQGRAVEPANILVVASTNRADGLDPALLRPGRFDRRLAFELPDKAGRREMVDHVLAKKSHEAELDHPERRDALAAVTVGYSPVQIEHLLDEALVNAVRRGSLAMNWTDVERARLTVDIGIASPVGYTDHEARLITTHEAGHATMAWLVAPHRRLEVLTMLKRKSALGMLAHGDREDVYTRSRSELVQLIDIAFGGMVAEDIFFGETSTGPAGDLSYATTVAAQMVGAAGMAGSLVSFEAIQSGPFGGANLVSQVLGDRDARARVEALLEESRARAMALLSENRHLVEALRDALLERHELVGSEITDVLEAAKAARATGLAELAGLAAAPAQPARPAVIDLRDDATTTTASDAAEAR